MRDGRRCLRRPLAPPFTRPTTPGGGRIAEQLNIERVDSGTCSDGSTTMVLPVPRRTAGTRAAPCREIERRDRHHHAEGLAESRPSRLSRRLLEAVAHISEGARRRPRRTRCLA